ncbi:MAG: squalene/phytoene synthase family protein [Verrucomicrobiae bacterium]|nr:squalene/phytoene synthase family protein [Verrucomicrobiae bacterium]
MNLDASYAFCRKLARRTGRNFYWSFYTLPPAKRQAMCAIYAWNRRMDDCVDDAPGAEAARRALDLWRDRTTRALAGDLPDAREADGMLWPALLDTVQKYQITDEYFQEIIRGAEMDIVPRHYATFDELYEYCYRVASVVGLICLDVFEFTHTQAKKHGEWLGIAFQLTNILRDISEDAQRGRVYLPFEDLKRFNLDEKEILQRQWSPELRDLLESYARRAEKYYIRAQPLLDLVSPDARPTLQIMCEVYGGILRRLREIDYRVFEQRARLSGFQKLRTVLRVARGSKLRGPAESEVKPPDISRKKIAIVGGGLSAIAVASALADFGFDLTLFEKSSRLGGSAAFFFDDRGGEPTENPLHVWLTCHRSFDDFISTLGARRYFHRREDWVVQMGGKFAKLSADGWIPGGRGWAKGAQSLGLNWSERSAVAKAFKTLVSYSQAELELLERVHFLDWLRFREQSESAIDRYWRPLCAIGIPDPVQQLSTRQAAIFLKSASGKGQLVWFQPTDSMAHLYQDICGGYLRSRQVRVRLREDVSGVFADDRGWHVVTRDASEYTFDSVVLTVAPHSLRSILNPRDYGILTARHRVGRLKFNPGVVARFEFRQPVIEEPVVLLNEAPFNWAVSAQVPRLSGVRRSPFTMVFKGFESKPALFTVDPDLLSSRSHEIWEEVLGQKAPVDDQYWVEMERIFSSEPENYEHRPSQETALEGLYLSGDWTRTDCPAGIEGRVRSAYRCAEEILKRAGWKIQATPAWWRP